MSIALLLDPTFRTTPMWMDALRRAMPAEHIVLAGELSHAAAEATVDIALVRGVDPGDLRRFTNLALVQCLWAGVDKLIVDPSVPTDVTLARMVDPALADQMATTALAHTLDICLHHHDYRERQARAVWQPRHAKPMTTKTVAILGFGALGKRCAEYLAMTGANIVGARSSRTSAEDHAPWRTTTCLAETVANADVVINLLPLTEETVGVLGEALFAACTPGAALINLGRGAHLVENDLLASLAAGHLSRAVLDVFTEEPLPAEHPFWGHPKITVTPHVAAETDPHTAASVIAANVAAVRSGRIDRITGMVDRTRGY